MENRESESELNECKKKLNKAHQTIEELKIKMTQDKKNHKWEIREINKRIEQATDKNLELYDRESKALIYADQLEKEKNILVKEKREHEKKIEKLERENEQLKEELAKITERKNFSNIDFSDLKSGKRGQPERVYYLNEEQATFVMILSILVYTFFTRMFDFMLPLVVKYSIVAA